MKHPKKRLTLALSTQNLINHYLHLSLGGKSVQTPYYINEYYDRPTLDGKVLADTPFHYRKKKTRKSILIGKGTPEEIETVVKEYAKKFNFSLEKSTTEEIKRFMEKHGIGIDCSGLVVWILNEMMKEKLGKSLWSFIDFGTNNPFRKCISHLRPSESISVKVLRSERNSVLVNDIKDIQVGDLIICWQEHHVLLITEICFNKNESPIYFEYINSTWWYGKHNGVLKGKVTIVNPKGLLLDQEWEDFQGGKNWTLEGVKHEGEIMRLKALADLTY